MFKKEIKNMKYELLKNNFIEYKGRKLYRIRALKSFSDIKCGDIGGYVENEKNLSQNGNCWIYNNAKVYDDGRVFDNAIIKNNAEVFGNASVLDNAIIQDDAVCNDNSVIYRNAVCGTDTKVYGHGLIYEGTYLNININSDIKRDEITAAYEKEQREKEERERISNKKVRRESKDKGYDIYIDNEKFHVDENGTMFTESAWNNLLE